MCDPATIAAIVTAGASLFSVATAAPPPAPPPAEVPAPPVAPARTSGAIVRLGIGAEDKTTDTTTPELDFTERRASANSLGNLGRSGLTI